MFIAIGFLLNEKNAKYLLAGYTTMSEEERKNINIEKYIPFFKKFHIFLGFSFGILGWLIDYFIGENAAGIFLGVYPILAYIIFIWESKNYAINHSKKWNNLSVSILIIVLIGVVGLFYYGFKKSELTFDNQQLTISGMYGKTLKADEFSTIQLVENTPKIKYRSNGFALGTIRKGYFKTIDGEKILLILNGNQKPLIFIKTKTELKIYFSAKDQSNSEIFKKLKATFPNTQYQSK